jgi:4'-phosphopantetheinyl transferase
MTADRLASAISEAAPELKSDDVHIWRADLSIDKLTESGWTDCLSADEIERAARFKSPPDMRIFCVARTMLRIVLATYMDCRPEQLEFGYTNTRRPFLLGHDQMQFNISHSGSRVLIGVTRKHDIGVDVEKMHAGFEVSDIARRFFSAAERAVIEGLPIEQRFQAFFDCWTRKEAFLKATGDGLFRDLDSFDVSVSPNELPQLLATRPDSREVDGWEFMLPDPGAGYAAAVIVRSSGTSLQYWQSAILSVSD